MGALLIGYARVSTDGQDLTAQRDPLSHTGVTPERIYVDHGLTGTNRDRPGLREALAACRRGDTLVVTDARAIAAELTARQVRLSLAGSVYDPTDPVGRLLFTVLATVAELESDLISMRTREGLKVARTRGRLRGKQPKLTARQETHLAALHARRRVHPRRTGRTVQGRPLHRLPSPAPRRGPQHPRRHGHLPAAARNCRPPGSSLTRGSNSTHRCQGAS